MEDAVSLRDGPWLRSRSCNHNPRITYNKPKRNTPVKPILFVVDICNFQMMGIGMSRIITSVRTSDMTNPRFTALVLSQWALIVAALVHQVAILVPHWKANAKKNDRDHSAITTHTASEQRLKRRPTKSLRYNRRTLNLIKPYVRAYQVLRELELMHINKVFTVDLVFHLRPTFTAFCSCEVTKSAPVFGLITVSAKASNCKTSSI